MSGTIQKFVIKAYDNEQYDGQPISEFTAQFNPTEYTRKYEVEYHENQGAGDTASPQTFGSIKPQEFTFEFFIDGTGVSGEVPKAQGQDIVDMPEKGDVEKAIQNFLTVTGKNNSEIHRPNYLILIYGTLITKCVLKSADITYTLFKPDGTPIRAKIKFTISENFEDTLRVAEADNRSPDLSHIRTVQEGDTLPLMAHKIYGDASYYIQLAAFNGIDNFRKLRVGSEIIFPPIKNIKV